MSFNRNHVRAFLAKTEINLFESSFGADLKALTAADVQRRIDRTRKLRTKYRDLLQRQKLATRARTANKAGTRGDANERTAKKAKAFDETLARFEAHARHLEAAGRKVAVRSKSTTKVGSTATQKTTAKKRPTKRKLVPAAVMLREVMEKNRNAETSALAALPTRSRKAQALSAASIGGVGATPPDVRAAAVASRLDQSGLKRIQGHTGTQVRMAQAKRDHRG
jgi:hypothetical protein